MNYRTHARLRQSAGRSFIFKFTVLVFTVYAAMAVVLRVLFP